VSHTDIFVDVNVVGGLRILDYAIFKQLLNFAVDEVSCSNGIWVQFGKNGLLVNRPYGGYHRRIVRKSLIMLSKSFLPIPEHF